MKPHYIPKWDRRWLVVRLSLAFCAGIIVYCVGFGHDDGLRQAALISAFGLAGTVVTGYLGIAAYDDRNVMKLALRSGKTDSQDNNSND